MTNDYEKQKDAILRISVRWADGTYDTSKKCTECGLETCSMPVHADVYKVISNKKAKEFDVRAFNDEEGGI